MAITLSEQTIQHTVRRDERTTAVNLNTNAGAGEDDYTIDVVREVAEYKDDALQSTNRASIPATPQDGGFESELNMTVAELHKHTDRKIVMEDGREIPVTDLLEIVSKGCDIISEIRREERRLTAAAQA